MNFEDIIRFTMKRRGKMILIVGSAAVITTLVLFAGRSANRKSLFNAWKRFRSNIPSGELLDVRIPGSAVV